MFDSGGKGECWIPKALKELTVQLTVDLKDDACVLHISGDVDRTHCQRFRHALHALVKGGHRRIGLDFTAVDFLDSSSVPAIVHAMHDLPSNVSGHIEGVSTMTRRVFSVLGYGGLLPAETAEMERTRKSRRRLFDSCGRSA